MPKESESHMIGVFSSAILNIPYLTEYFEGAFLFKCHLSKLHRFFTFKRKPSVILGWSRRETIQKRGYAEKSHIPFWSLEDGFLRSYGLGRNFPPLSLICDKTGIYYDSTCPSDLELLLASSTDLLGDVEGEVLQAIELIKAHRLSKYNHAPEEELTAFKPGPRILVIDQTVGDCSVTFGAADRTTFDAMLAAARSENPSATIYVKTHPEVSANYKAGYLADVQEDEHTVVLRNPINPVSLLEHMDKVYVVTSQLGFEALLLDKPVVVFGLPWYAGWGCTNDRQVCCRRTRTRNVKELFAAAYIHYARYLNPYTHKKGTISDVIHWLIQQKETLNKLNPNQYEYHLEKWTHPRKKNNLRAFLSLQQEKIKTKPLSKQPTRDIAIYWGSDSLSQMESPTDQLQIEDGFIRSVGLGCKGASPYSLVADKLGIYFDSTRPSDLEIILNTHHFDELLLKRARQVRRFIVENQLTKYNTEPLTPPRWSNGNAPVILIPGQVSDDASIKLGTTEINNNFALIQAVRAKHPDAYIVYKPHPDVLCGARQGKLSRHTIASKVDYIETQASIISCIQAADAIHTMTSLSGFDALLRGKSVVTYGEPFYAGWGLTEDKHMSAKTQARRTRRLSIDELVAGVLLSYPLYYDWELNGYTSCEAVLRWLVIRKNKLD